MKGERMCPKTKAKGSIVHLSSVFVRVNSAGEALQGDVWARDRTAKQALRAAQRVFPRFCSFSGQSYYDADISRYHEQRLRCTYIVHSITDQPEPVFHLSVGRCPIGEES